MPRLRLAADPRDGDLPAHSRPAWTTTRVARELACDVATVAKLLKRGSLEGFRFGGGSRARWRVYADSVARFREAGAPPPARRGRAPQPAPALRPEDDPRHREAVAYLKSKGVL